MDSSTCRPRKHGHAVWIILAVGIITVLSAFGIIRFFQQQKLPQLPDWVAEDIIPIGSGRSGKAIDTVNGIVIHYVGNPGTTAAQNRSYFAQIGTKVCSHFVIGIDGETIQCVPLDERSAASNDRNRDTISIEVCHEDESGQFSDEAYSALVRLTAWLCGEYGLDSEDVIRHYDVSGKLCPLYYVEHEDAWEQLRRDIDSAIKEG